MNVVAWLDCSCGVSGDMLLGALASVGALDIDALVAALPVDVTVTTSVVRRSGVEALRVEVQPAESQPHRRLADVIEVVDRAELADEVKAAAGAVFERLARAEARVHGVDPAEVIFHEVGAVDAIVDVVGSCVGVRALAAAEIVVTSIALGGGSTKAAHGVLPVPGPAVLELLRESGLAAHGGPVPVELATPTGVAVLASVATRSGAMPGMSISSVGAGAGGRDLDDRPNVVRLVLGTVTAPTSTGWQLMEANVDDLDPRLWPIVLDRLLAAGAADAWLSPIVMKKGRPAHTLVALATDSAADAVAAAVFAESSTIGMRTTPVGKRELEREWVDVDVDGQQVRVKVASLAGAVVNVSPEFDDVARAATALGRPVKVVLAAAAAAAHALFS